MNRKKALLLAAGGALLICLCLALAYSLGGWQVQIRLRGEDSAVLSYGDSYRDEGAEAVFCGKFILKDGISIPVQYDDSGLSEERLGSYEVVYTADFLGFHSTRSRRVQVVDDTPPEITLEYIEDYYTRPIDAYEEEGFSAWDNYDGIMTALTQAVEDMGYQYYDWNVTSGDAGETTSTEVVAQNVISGTQQHSVSVVLQHDIKSFSVDAVEEIIAWGIENGYTFLPLDETSPTAHHKVNN